MTQAKPPPLQPTPAPTLRERIFTWVVCVALFFGAFFLRLPGIGHGLPTTLEQDCMIPGQVELLRQGGDAWKTERNFRWYPLLIANVATQVPRPANAQPQAPLADHLRAASAPHLQTRLVVALFAALMAPAAYLLAALFLERRWAIVAGLLCAASLLSVNFSQQSRPHAAAGALFAWALLAFVRLRRRGGVLGHSLAGGALALALGCLQSALALLPALVVAVLARRTHKRSWLDLRLLLTVALVVSGIVVFYPYEFFGNDLPKQPGADAALINQSGHLLFLDQFRGGGFVTLARTFVSYEPALAALALLGLVLWATRRGAQDAANNYTRRRDLWVVLAFAVPYLLVLGLYNRTYERFAIPLLPMLACCAAFGLREVARRVPTRSAAAGFATWAVLAVLAIAPGAWLCLRLGEVRSQPHTTELAARWLEERASEFRPLDLTLTTTLDLPLLREPAGLSNWPGGPDASWNKPWSRYQANLPGGPPLGERWRLRWWTPKIGLMANDPARFVAEEGGEIAITEVFAHNRVHPGASRLREWLLANAELLVRISPDGDPNYSDHPFGYQEETSVAPGIFFRRLLQARGTGPVIEIFRLPRS